MTARQLHEGEKINRAEGGPEDREADLLREGRLDPGVLDEGITHLLGIALADVDAAAETPEEGLQHGLPALGPRAEGGIGRRRGSRDDVEGGGQDGDAVSVLSTALAIIPGSSTASYTTLRSWTQSRQAVLEAFLRGLRRGIDVCERDPQKMRDALVKHTGVKPALAQQIGLPVLRPTLRPVDLLPLMELARRHGLLVREVDIERLLSPGATR